MNLEERVSALEDAVRKLAAVVQADVEGLRITDAEVARQGRSTLRGVGWHETGSADHG